MKENTKFFEEIEDQITLTLDDGRELLCDVTAIFPVDGKEYIALLPVDDDDADIFLYRFIRKGEDDIDLINIDDDDEFEAVSDAFEELLDEADFDAMFDEDDYEDDDE